MLNAEKVMISGFPLNFELIADHNHSVSKFARITNPATFKL